MATEDKYVVTIETTNSQIKLENLLKKVESVYKGVATLSRVSTDAATKLRTYTVEVNNTTLAVSGLAAAQEKLAKSYKSVNVSSTFRGGRKTTKKAVEKVTSNKAQRQEDLAIVRSMFGGVPEVPSSVISGYRGGRVADLGSDISSKWARSIRPTLNRRSVDLTPLSGTGGSREFSGDVSDDLATGRTSKPFRAPWSVARGARPRSMAMASNISHKTYTATSNKQKQEAKQVGLLAKFNKGLKDVTKQTFMLQMGMLGVAFSSQSLISSFQGLGMQALGGLADTENAIKNLVLSDTLGGTNFMENLNFESFIDNSIKAQGALAGINSILVLIADKVFSNPEAATRISNAIVTIVEKLTSEEFIKSILGLVDAITKPEFINSLTTAAQKIADLINALGENGLLDKVILLILACQFLMPVLAIIQFALLVLGSYYFAGLIAVLLIVGAVVWAVASSLSEFGKSCNVFLDVFNVIYSSFVKLWELLLYIPKTVFDVISKTISDLTGGLVRLENPFSNFTNTLWKLKDMMNTSFGGGNSGYSYDTGSHQYVQINNFNKSVGSNSANEIISALKANSTKAL